MNDDTTSEAKQGAKTPQSTAALLCLLATYEAYGTGLASAGCLRALADKGGGR